MLVDVKQSELDLAEERLLIALFGSTEIDAKTQWLLKFLNIDINKLIQNFESTVKPLMLDNGMIDASLTKALVSSKYPMLANIVPSQNFRLVDVVELMKGVIGHEAFKG
jgi:hypothetical protein